MHGKYPKRTTTDKTAEAGINAVSSVVNDEFGWIFRRTHGEHDYGIDGYIDFVTEAGDVTGKFIAVQVKSGESYLRVVGNSFWYRDSKEHLNYFLNLPIPMLLILHDPRSKQCYWALLDSQQVELTESGWKHPVPKTNRLDAKSKVSVERIFGVSLDHVDLLEQDAGWLDLILKHSLIQYSVPKEDIESGNVGDLRDFLDRITRTERLTLSAQGKTCITVYGYEGDKRELFDIREVRRWAKKARRKISEWFIMTNDDPRLSTLKWMASCTCEHSSELKPGPDGRMGYLVVFNTDDLVVYLEECFEGLNAACEKWGWSKEYNFEISKRISRELLPDMPYD